MKRYILSAAILLASVGALKAESICTDWGTFNLCLPVSTGIDAAFGYDFRGHQSQGLAETGFAKLSVTKTSLLVFKAGGITTEKGKGAPFVGVDYELNGISNPIPGFASIRPGIYGGKDFHTNEYFYGVKASIPIVQ